MVFLVTHVSDLLFDLRQQNVSGEPGFLSEWPQFNPRHAFSSRPLPPCLPVGTDGNLGRNAFRGPAFKRSTFRSSRTSRWRPSYRQFQAEAFNLFNRVNLYNPIGDMGSPQFGKSTTAFPARQIQLGIEIAFLTNNQWERTCVVPHKFVCKCAGRDATLRERYVRSKGPRMTSIPSNVDQIDLTAGSVLLRWCSAILLVILSACGAIAQSSQSASPFGPPLRDQATSIGSY